MTIMSARPSGRTTAASPDAHVSMIATRGRQVRRFTGDPEGQYVRALEACGWSVSTLTGQAVA